MSLNPNHYQDLITATKADKSIAQPWRNKAVARLEEAQAFVEKGQRTTHVKPPEGMPVNGVPPRGETPPRPVGCECTILNGQVAAIAKGCMVHNR